VHYVPPELVPVTADKLAWCLQLLAAGANAAPATLVGGMAAWLATSGAARLD